MSPATRARLCAALERETGRGWTWDAMTLRAHDPASRLGIWPEREVTTLYNGAPWDTVATVPTPTGRGWPERLAVEVARVLAGTTTGGARA